MTRWLFVVALLLAAGPAFAIANPASEFCMKMGGRLDSVKDKSGGEIGLCYLPDERIIEEWTLFRMYDGKVP
ncbi:MAG: DUF333 domain-containing protein [Mesorhizobium sp.]|nr:DUF333 domain-containing protein [Mesorhizobium sp.]MBL8578616.1 DUF333 domain-containing protein [Mesorhizobium sp.]